MSGWTHWYELFDREIRQRLEEGCQLDGEQWRREGMDIAPKDRAAREALFDKLEALRPPIDMPFQEPSELEAIHNLRPSGARRLDGPRTAGECFDRIHGGWVGRMVGATLGLPLECPPFTMSAEEDEQGKVLSWLEGADAWPLEDYVPGESRAAMEGLRLRDCESTRGEVQRVEPSQQTRHPLLTLRLLEESGRDFDTSDLARCWLELRPFHATEHAETQVYLSLAGEEAFCLRHPEREKMRSFNWERMASHRNPYREWNGAQPRADIYGLINPCEPEQAAAMAWRDARLSQTKNGLYGPMFCAALIAGSFAMRETGRLIELALSEIPASCRAARAIGGALRAHREGMSWEENWDRARQKHGEYDRRHAIPNLVNIVLALLYGEGDFSRSVALAAAGGFAPAANAATVGAVLGVQLSARAIPRHWSAPLYNTVDSDVPGATHGTISDGARRTAALLAERAPGEVDSEESS